MHPRIHSSSNSMIPVNPNIAHTSPSTDRGDVSRSPIFATSDEVRGGREQPTVAFVKGTKRKRLSKVRQLCFCRKMLSVPILSRLAMRATKASGAVTVQVKSIPLFPLSQNRCSHPASLAPCSNWWVTLEISCHVLPDFLRSYFASKRCTYTDSSGRPVPAPRNLTQERPLGPLAVGLRHPG